MAPANPDPNARAASPGRPKDLGKRAAILDAAKRMFVEHGYEGVSMDEIAAEAGVSKLTVYSHFGDKETLFAAAARAHCEKGLPPTLFDPAPEVPLRERLLGIGRAFFALITSHEAIAGHRTLFAPQLMSSSLPEMFWTAGPQRVLEGLTTLLQRRVAAGELEIDDVPRAASQLCSLFKGEQHMRLLLGLRCADDTEAHLQAAVELFLRAYGTDRARSGRESR